MRRSIRNFNIHPEVFELFKTYLFKFPSHQVMIVVKCPPPPRPPLPYRAGFDRSHKCFSRGKNDGFLVNVTAVSESGFGLWKKNAVFNILCKVVIFDTFLNFLTLNAPHRVFSKTWVGTNEYTRVNINHSQTATQIFPYRSRTMGQSLFGTFRKKQGRKRWLFL